MEAGHMPRRHIIVVAAAFFFIAIVLGLANNINSLYMIPLTQSLGFSRSAYALTKSLSGFAFMLSNTFFVMLYRRYGFRKPATLFTLLTALGYVGYSIAEGIFPFFLGALLFGIGEAFLNSAGISMLISNWFHSHQGRMLGIVLSASGLGGAVLSIALGALINGPGWRVSFIVSALLLVLSALIVFFLLKDHPEECGLAPYEGHDPRPVGSKRLTPDNVWEGIPFAKLKKMPVFYLVMAATFLCCICANSTYCAYVIHLQDLHIAPTTAASCASVMLFALAGSKIILGQLSDRFGSKLTLLLCTLCGIIGLLVLIRSSTVLLALISAVTVGIFTCMSGFMQPVIALDMFGHQPYSEMVSALMVMMAGASIVASPLTNLVFDIYHSYTPIFYAFIVISIISAVLFLICYKKAEQLRKQLDKGEEA